jgi:hypothetical protein
VPQRMGIDDFRVSIDHARAQAEVQNAGSYIL